MGSQRSDIDSIQAQLTVAKWHLDAATNAVADIAAHKLQSARLAYAGILRSLSKAKLTSDERELIERELRALRSRLQFNGRSPPPDASSLESGDVPQTL